MGSWKRTCPLPVDGVRAPCVIQFHLPRPGLVGLTPGKTRPVLLHTMTGSLLWGCGCHHTSRVQSFSVTRLPSGWCLHA